MAVLVSPLGSRVPCVLHEDEHLLVVCKPAGLNTHAPGPYAGEGLYEWLRDREPRWSSLSILHRLDKETSGVLVFGRSEVANRSLTAQFTERRVRKEYVFATRRAVTAGGCTVTTSIVRVGGRYVPRAASGEQDLAETEFTVEGVRGEFTWVRARPRTGRTHQIRVHAAHAGFPIHGDVLYGGDAAERVWLHAERIEFLHPATGNLVAFHVPADFEAPCWRVRREALIACEETDAFRCIHGAGDLPEEAWRRWGGVMSIDRLGQYLLVQSAGDLTDDGKAWLKDLMERAGLAGVYFKRLDRQVRRIAPEEASPRLVLGAEAPESFGVREHGVRFEVRFGEGYSVGLFLDQRDNRRRWLSGYVGAGFGSTRGAASNSPNRSADNPVRRCGDEAPALLNLFAYTCGFSVVAGLAGWRTTSVDMSRKYLAWGRRNFGLNALDPAGHEFLYGDAFDWLKRLARKGRLFEAVVVDPPTFSQSKESGVFRVTRDYGRLVGAVLKVLKPGGVLLASANAAGWAPEDFVGTVEIAVLQAGRRVLAQTFEPQPPDFPITRAEPGYLKSLWLRIGG